MLELIAAAVGSSWRVWGIQSLEHHAFFTLSLQVTEHPLFVGRVSGNLRELDMRDVGPIQEAGEFDDPPLMRLGAQILTIPYV